ncbi:class I SAM-dependent methyltransferase [Candidatus Peregrinibacteria bacterium]|nr:class I SAM-dependent methyltransferase [Candidatus Peregrinibacteria bacterium]
MNSYSINKKWWEKMVQDGCGFTVPWLDLDAEVLKKLAKGELEKPPKPLDEIYPLEVLKNIKGKKVLCLASGGGQQSAVFSLLGAQVTVADISEGQLAGDQKAAKHYRYEVNTIQASMDNLFMIHDESFDLVYQAPSMSYTPDVKKVYSEVARILKHDGVYRADASNPLAWGVDIGSWDGKGYHISKPYSMREERRSENENVIEFRHYVKFSTGQ